MIIKTDPDFTADYSTDASNMHGTIDKLCLPQTEAELSSALAEAYADKIPITFSGAKTGLVGGAVPLGGMVVSSERMLEEPIIDTDKMTVTCSAGTTLVMLNEALSAKGLFYPVNPTEQNATLGGNVAANASGARTFRYGQTRRMIKSLRVVLGDGDIIEVNSELKPAGGRFELRTESGRILAFDMPQLTLPSVKHAAGYYSSPEMNACDLFAGSEGTLGAISKIELAVLPAPERVFGAIAFFKTEEELFAYTDEIRRKSKANFSKDYRINKDICARLTELFDSRSLGLIRDKYKEIPRDIFGAVWTEQEFADENEDAVISSWYELIERSTSLHDYTWSALGEREHERFREFRHDVPLATNEIVVRNGQTKINPDIAVPDKSAREMYRFLNDGLTSLGLDNVIFGHIGNSHFHTNIFVKSEIEKQKASEFYDAVIEKSISLGGTIAAEHGVGKLKTKYLCRLFGSEGIGEMKRIKSVFDPENLLGRGTLFSL